MLLGGNFLGVMKPLLLQIKEKVKFIGEICFIYSSCSLYMCLDPYYILLVTWDSCLFLFTSSIFLLTERVPKKNVTLIYTLFFTFCNPIMDEHKALVNAQCCPLLNEPNSSQVYYIFKTLGFEVCIDDEVSKRGEIS